MSLSIWIRRSQTWMLHYVQRRHQWVCRILKLTWPWCRSGTEWAQWCRRRQCPLWPLQTGSFPPCPRPEGNGTGFHLQQNPHFSTFRKILLTALKTFFLHTWQVLIEVCCTYQISPKHQPLPGSSPCQSVLCPDRSEGRWGTRSSGCRWYHQSPERGICKHSQLIFNQDRPFALKQFSIHLQKISLSTHFWIINRSTDCSMKTLLTLLPNSSSTNVETLPLIPISMLTLVRTT